MEPSPFFDLGSFGLVDARSFLDEDGHDRHLIMQGIVVPKVGQEDGRRYSRRREQAGSPPMNLLRGRAAGGRIAVGDVELVDPQVSEGDVLMGIRPAGLRPVGKDRTGPVLEVSVEVVEHLGDEVLVHGSIEGRDVDVQTRPEDEALLAEGGRRRAGVILRLPPEERPKLGSRLRLAIAEHTVRLLDPATGLAVRPR